MKHIFSWIKEDFISRLNSKKSKFKSVRVAFTLAEVLITLGIIGVVAALTMPTLIQNHQKQVYVTGLKKAYSNLSNAFSKMAYDEGVTDWKDLSCFAEIDYNSQEAYEVYWNKIVQQKSLCYEQITKQFNVINNKPFYKSCSEGAEWCKKIGEFAESSAEEEFGVLLTSDGMTYLFDCTWLGYIVVDVNGTKGPNKWGRDVFKFDANILQNKVEPYGIQEWYNPDAWKDCSATNLSKDCTAKVIIEGKMDY